MVDRAGPRHRGAVVASHSAAVRGATATTGYREECGGGSGGRAGGGGRSFRVMSSISGDGCAGLPKEDRRPKRGRRSAPEEYEQPNASDQVLAADNERRRDDPHQYPKPRLR